MGTQKRDTNSDLRHAAYAISITAVVRGSLSIPDREKKPWLLSTASYEV